MNVLNGVSMMVFPFAFSARFIASVSGFVAISINCDFFAERIFSSAPAEVVPVVWGSPVVVFDSESFLSLCSSVFITSAKSQVDLLQRSLISSKSSFGSVWISSISFRKSSCAAIESSRALCFSRCSIWRISERISRLYDGRPGMNTLAISAVSYKGLLIGIPFSFKKSVSKDMKCPIIGKSPMKFPIFCLTSSRGGASATSSFLMFVIWVMNSGMGTPGFIRVCRVSVFCFGSRLNLIPPNSVIWFFLLSSPVVSRSREMNIVGLLGFAEGAGCAQEFAKYLSRRLKPSSICSGLVPKQNLT